MVDTATQLRLEPDGRWAEAPHALPITAPATVQLRSAPTSPPWRIIITAAVILIVIVVFAGILISTYRTSASVTMEGGVPVIRADRTEFRVRPEQPGGIDIPNQDRLVLQDLGRARAPVTVATMLPPPEQPLPRPVPAGAEQRGWRLPLPAASPGAGVVEILLQRPGQAVAAAPAPAEPAAPAAVATAAVDAAPPSAAAPPPAAAPVTAMAPPPAVAPANPPSAAETAASVSPVAQAAQADDPIAALLNNPAAADGWINPDAAAPVQVAGLTPPHAAVPTIVAVPDGHFAAQIAAVTSPEEAQAEWSRFQRRFPELFGGLQLAVPQVSASARLGYRVQAVPLDQATATRLCDALASEKTGCLVVPR